MNQFNNLNISILRSELENLPDNYRLALRLRFWENNSIDEISKVLRKDWGIVDKLLDEGMSLLKKSCLDHPLFSLSQGSRDEDESNRFCA